MAIENEKKFKCQICDYKAIEKYQLSRHIKYSHETTSSASVKCSKCSKTFDNNKKFKSHVQKYHTFKHCPQCDQGISKGLFKNHLGKKVCKICGKSFECLGLLQKYKGDCDAQHLTCEFCSKEFPVKCLLKYHINRHHVCKNKENVDQAALKFANESCLGLKFECSHCSKKFERKSYLWKHLTNLHHLIEKKFRCAECDRKYYDRSSLKQHLTGVHSKVTVECSICQSKMKSSSLKHHMIQLHCIKI
ncbi:oocyte zinc finger protein XlCOF6-like [Neocloeon triangulifer]|uniref:oocyte zinc finger protein XlCOF6-like n=1 Tax=Neocloeon triangulifer TaxID=2078957 RepID=UPI00286F7878|nr:oocyte zinc finger protein XlCOF6-like [Neocloeon triangulifer]